MKFRDYIKTIENFKNIENIKSIENIEIYSKSRLYKHYKNTILALSAHIAAKILKLKIKKIIRN